MSIPTFTAGYPPDGSSLGNTKAVIRDNLDGTFQVFSVDHQDQNEAGAGSHTKVSLKETTSSNTPTLPPNIMGIGFETLYSQPAGTPSLGEVFYSRGGSGVGVQLTGPGIPTTTPNGYSFIAGGIMIQWGVVNSIANNGTVTFSPAFQNNCFNVQLTPRVSATTGQASTMYTEQPTVSSFKWYNVAKPTSGIGFFWMAIGN